MNATTKQYLVNIADPGRAERREWFTPSASLMTDEDSPSDGALYTAQKWNNAAYCTLVRDQNGKLVTRTAA